MNFQSIVNKVEEIDVQKRYWFVRTDNGQYFQHYYDNGFIAIGWNYITINDLQQSSQAGTEIKLKVAQHSGLDIGNNAIDKRKATSIYNKLRAFRELRTGDLIIIPSHSSQRLAFGYIVDNILYSNIDDPECDFYKRRKVNWIENKDIDELDKIFYQIRVSRHTISSVKKYESYIDKVVQTLFMKDGYSHYVMDLATNDDINFKTLLELINRINEITEKLNDDFHLGEDLNNNSIKLNLQSPGKIEFKFLNGKSLILLATLLGPLSLGPVAPLGGINDAEIQQLENFKQVNQQSLQDIESALEELEVDRDKINSIY